MKKYITATVIAILLIIVLVLVAFILSDKRIVISDSSNNEQTTESVNETATEVSIFDPSVAGYTEEKTSALAKNIQNNKIIVIDAGHQSHGNSDQEPIGPGSSETKAKVSSGTSGVSTGIPEYEVNLQIAQKLNTELTKRGYSVTMVRNTNDVDISNAERAEVANSLNADAFLRIHCNGDYNRSVKGTLTMCQTADNPYCGQFYEKSRKLSDCILVEICANTGSQNRGVIETDTMSGINWCQVPVTIIETGFMSNPDEDKLLSDEAYQLKIVKGIADGLDNYFKK